MSRLPNLQKSLKLGNLVLKNRVVLASQTRNRVVGTVPNQFVEDYYAQRAGAGLLLTEGTLVTPQGSEWPNAPGIWNAEQVEGWRRVTKKVHDNDSLIFCQLWHIGRVAHPLHQSGEPALAPSNIGAKGGKFRLLVGEPGYVSNPSPIKDPRVIIEQFRNAAVNAKAAGFDGVELHSANGYLPNQFLEAHSNQRTDEWGGSVQNRARFVLEIIKVLIDVMGDPKRVGIKLSPGSGYNDMGDPIDVLTEEYTHIITELDALDIGYIQLVRYSMNPDQPGTPNNVLETFGPLVKKPLLISNGGYSGDEADTEIAANKVAAVAFGHHFISNPDLPSRLWNGQEIDNSPYYAIYFSPPEGQSPAGGYTDFPVYKEQKKVHPAA